MSRSNPDLSLPQQCDPAERDRRRGAVDSARGRYQFDHSWKGYPPSIRKLPWSERSWLFYWKLIESGLNMVRAFVSLTYHRIRFTLIHLLRPTHPFEIYDALYGSDPPEVAKDDAWREDATFAAQRLNGMYPWFIERLDDLAAFQEECPVDDARLAGLLPPGATLADLQAAGRLYVVRQSSLRGATPAHGHVMTAPTSLFFVNNADELMPLAIQLHSGEEGHPDPVLTPNDDPNTWLGLKTHASCADNMIHAIYSHLILLHFVMCNVWTAANRSLAPEHPILAFLKPHFWSTLVITSTVKGTIDKPKGLLCKITGFGYTGQNEVIPRLYEAFDFSHYDPRVEFARRGLDDRTKLPNFFYRDDSMRLWEADLQYVRSMMDLFYRTDEDVREDAELQAWIAEMASSAGAGIRGLPVGSNGRLETREKLHELLASILFTVTSRHSSTEIGAERFVYAPANPFSYRLLAPLRSTDQYSLRTVADRLPPIGRSILAKELIQAADFDAKRFRGIGQYESGFTDGWPPGARDAVWAWQRALADITTEINARNEKLDTPYEGMNPRHTFNSIWN